jgi:hypothetical protein
VGWIIKISESQPEYEYSDHRDELVRCRVHELLPSQETLTFFHLTNEPQRRN